MNSLKYISLVAAVGSAAALWAEAPAGYYSSCEGKTGKALLQQLEDVVGSHTAVNYKNLYDVYETSDKHPDGRIWDMYSTKNWGNSFRSASLCGNYSKVGDCINKEHSFPKSWFDDKSPMMSDAFHIYPTDGKVNGQRSNYPYGECANGTTLPGSGSVQALGKLGSSTFPGYSGTVFEPDDEYKGDFARSYFYMAAAYNSRISTWNSPMLAGNNYPCFSSWSVDLLLKWHRNDPVSDKETVRNDAVYAHQHNRNPFIDHPEMVEYIWGNKQGQGWSEDPGAAFLSPADNATIAFGTNAKGHAMQKTVTVAGHNFTENIAVTVSGSDFAVAPASLAAAQVNGSGATLTLTYTPATTGSHSATVTLAAEGEQLTLNLTGNAIDGLPALAATNVSEDGFTANWVCIDGASDLYTLNVMREGASIEGYPLQVTAGDGSYHVTGLEPETPYTYTVSNGSLTSAAVSVTTAAPVPSVEFLYDGDLGFSTTPGVPSDAAEILAEIDNIPGDVTLMVTAPFELSLNKTDWSTTVVLAPGADRFYMRLGAADAGRYTTSLVATADGGFHYDDVIVEGSVGTGAANFIEDFEPAATSSSYQLTEYTGSACRWNVSNIYLTNSGDQAYAHESTQAARTNKNGARYLEMAEDKANGAGVISFWAHLWRTDSEAAIFDVMVSTDHGTTWTTVGNVTVSANKDAGGQNVYAQFSVTANTPGAVRIKVNQTAGGRCMVDDLAITDYRNSSGLLTPDGYAYHSWDAFCVNGELVIENSDAANHFFVYSIDGRQVFAGTAAEGRTSVALPEGLYVVTVGDFARRVLVK